jgi:hypothetical protein
MARLRRESSCSYSGRSVLASTAETPGTAIREDRCGSTGVSRGHSTGSYEPVNAPEGLTTREWLNWAGSSDHGWTEASNEADRPSRLRASRAEKECCLIRKDCPEPPDADPHVRWCGSREAKPPGDPIWSTPCGVLPQSSFGLLGISFNRVADFNTIIVCFGN